MIQKRKINSTRRYFNERQEWLEKHKEAVKLWKEVIGFPVHSEKVFEAMQKEMHVKIPEYMREYFLSGEADRTALTAQQLKDDEDIIRSFNSEQKRI